MRSKALPVPRLIAVEIDRDDAARHRQLARRAGRSSSRAFRSTTTAAGSSRSVPSRARSRSGGLAILLLVGAATTAIIVSATRSAMASNREIVEVLHFVGATDRYIAREFERHFLRLGVRAGLVGAVSRHGVFFLHADGDGDAGRRDR